MLRNIRKQRNGHALRSRAGLSADLYAAAVPVGSKNSAAFRGADRERSLGCSRSDVTMELAVNSTSEWVRQHLQSSQAKSMARLFYAASAALLLACALIGGAFVSFEMTEFEVFDTRSCRGCRALALYQGQPLLDDRRRPLEFATPASAKQYADDY